MLASLNGVPEYRRLFAEAYPEDRSGRPIALPEVLRALTAFQTSLVSLNSRYDRYACIGYHAALNDRREIEGMNVFRSFVARCSRPHAAAVHEPAGRRDRRPEPKGRPFDVGAENTFHASEAWKAASRCPRCGTSRAPAPYMHSGAFPSLRDTVVFYNKGRGNAVPEG